MDTSIRVNSCLEAILSRCSYVVTEEFWDTHGLRCDHHRDRDAVTPPDQPAKQCHYHHQHIEAMSLQAANSLNFILDTSDFLIYLLVISFTIIASFAGGFIYGDSDYIRLQILPKWVDICGTELIFFIQP